MKEITMLFNGKPIRFQVIYEEPAYIFCDSKEVPAARGFYTRAYITQNVVK